MTHRIFHIGQDKSLTPLTEQPYDAESLLQELLARYPDLLGGGEETRRWLLIKREISIPFEGGNTNRWSLDHLFVDEDAIPTLVEVKRSTDTRIRREVIGQLLDYAANAVIHWPAEKIEAEFRINAEKQGSNADEILQEFLGDEKEPAQFWDLARTNLQAGKIRLVFVADIISPELRRIVEFLNKQMSPAEVIALEVKQFVGDGTKTLVPKLIGRTSEAEMRKVSTSESRRIWNQDEFFDILKNRSQAEFDVAKAIYNWATSNNLRIAWGHGAVNGAFYVIFDHDDLSLHTIVVRLGRRNEALIRFQFGRMVHSPFDTIEGRKELASQLKSLTGIVLREDNLNGFPSIKLLELSDDKRLQGFLQT